MDHWVVLASLEKVYVRGLLLWLLSSREDRLSCLVLERSAVLEEWRVASHCERFDEAAVVRTGRASPAVSMVIEVARVLELIDSFAFEEVYI